MAVSRASILIAALILIIAACTPGPQPRLSDPNRGEPLLTAGVTSYEEGEYDLAEKNLKSALKMGLTDKWDKVSAHKHLAFIYCVTSRQALGQEEFKKAFEIDPKFELSPAEAGHPLWGPIYRKVKAQMTPAVKKTP